MPSADANGLTLYYEEHGAGEPPLCTAEIPGARLTVIEGGPHALQLEKAQEFSAAVLDFIADAAVSA